MAEFAGRELIDRWADWDGRPFKADDERHISIYAKDNRWALARRDVMTPCNPGCGGDPG